MRKIQGSGLFLAAQILGDITDACHGQTTGIVRENKVILEMLDVLVRQLQESALKVSVYIAEITQGVLSAPTSTINYDYFRGQITALKEAVHAELRTHLFFQMDDELRGFFEKSQLFGTEAELKFPSASFDIEEGGKCLALGRPTATVFHMMRVMEVGLKSLARELKIPYAPSWESYIRQIEAQITAKHKSKSRKWKAVEPFYRDMLGDLISIKIAWRNPTMHIVRNYTSQEAEDVFRTVRTFMSRLSKNLSQV